MLFDDKCLETTKGHWNGLPLNLEMLVFAGKTLVDLDS